MGHADTDAGEVKGQVMLWLLFVMGWLGCGALGGLALHAGRQLLCRPGGWHSRPFDVLAVGILVVYGPIPLLVFVVLAGVWAMQQVMRALP